MKGPQLHFVGACILCVIVSIGYVAWYNLIKDTSMQIALTEDQLRAHTQTEKRIAAARASLTQIDGYDAKIRNYFLEESAVSAFIDKLQSDAENKKVKLEVLSVGKEPVSGHPMLSLTLSITGTFDAVMRTTGGIEYAPYAMSISAYSIQNQSPNVWHATMTLAVGLASTTASTTQTVTNKQP